MPDRGNGGPWEWRTLGVVSRYRGCAVERLAAAQTSLCVCSCVGLGFRLGLGNRVRVRNRV